MNRDWYEFCVSRLDLPLEIKKKIFELTFETIWGKKKIPYKRKDGYRYSFFHPFRVDNWVIHHHELVPSLYHIEIEYVLLLRRRNFIDPEWCRFIDDYDGELKSDELALIKLY